MHFSTLSYFDILIIKFDFYENKTHKQYLIIWYKDKATIKIFIKEQKHVLLVKNHVFLNQKRRHIVMAIVLIWWIEKIFYVLHALKGVKKGGGINLFMSKMNTNGVTESDFIN